jgi:uroporphyrin-III C-methyltransferase / precorrin-2 dehydrogenase / sirohydrochlorin ferrochelatase
VEVFPAFLLLQDRPVVLVGGGKVASSKLTALLAARAHVKVVAPEIRDELRRPGVTIVQRGFEPGDLDGAWFAVSAANASVNREVAKAAEERRIFLNAADDPGSASAYLGGVVRKGGVTVAISTGGGAPALAGLLREAFEAFIPDQIADWLETARELRRKAGVPMHERRPLLLKTLLERNPQ